MDASCSSRRQKGGKKLSPHFLPGTKESHKNQIFISTMAINILKNDASLITVK
jgi:hypothetical protein